MLFILFPLKMFSYIYSGHGGFKILSTKSGTVISEKKMLVYFNTLMISLT